MNLQKLIQTHFLVFLMFRDQNFITPNYILLSISFPGRYLLVEKNYETRRGPRRWNLSSRLVFRRLFVFRRKNCNSSCHFRFWIFFNVTWKPRWILISKNDLYFRNTSRFLSIQFLKISILKHYIFHLSWRRRSYNQVVNCHCAVTTS